VLARLSPPLASCNRVPCLASQPAGQLKSTRLASNLSPREYLLLQSCNCKSVDQQTPRNSLTLTLILTPTLTPTLTDTD
jgi:hypothetical protein